MENCTKNKNIAKPTMLFDACCILDAFDNYGDSRSGIYFCALNLLKRFVASGKFDISLYCDNQTIKKVENFCQSELGASLPVFNLPQNIFVNALQSMIFSITKSIDTYSKFAILSKMFKVFRKVFKVFRKRLTPRFVFDIAFSPSFRIPSDVAATRKYIVVHDLIPKKFGEKYPARGKWQNALLASLDEKTYCFANSECTRNDFLEFSRLKDEQIEVALHAAQEHFKPVADEAKIAEVREKYGIPSGKKYVFSLCTLEPRKNLLRAVSAFVEFVKKNSTDDIVFVLGGGHWDAFMKQLNNAVAQFGRLSKIVMRIGYVMDEDLPALYSGAHWFVYTSEYEGFGIPPLEAMSCGCPVVASKTSALPEVVGDAAISIDYASVEEHIAAYEKYYFDEAFRSQKSREGLERSKRFSWNKCAEQMMKKMLVDFERTN